MRLLAIALSLLTGVSCLADIGLVSDNAEHTWALYATGDGKVALAECVPPLAAPTRACGKNTRTEPRAQFLKALEQRLALQTVLPIQSEIDYLTQQSQRLEEKLKSDLPPSAKQALQSTKLVVDTKLADAKKTLGAQTQGAAANLAFYQKAVAKLEQGNDWVIDAVESPSDYGMHLPNPETSLVAFLRGTFGVDTTRADQEVSLALAGSDSTFDNADDVTFDLGKAGYAVLGSSNQYSHADRAFASLLVFYGSDGSKQWEDATNDFHRSYGAHAFVSTGPQSFAVIGSNGAKEEASQVAQVRVVKATAGVPSANVWEFPQFTRFRSVVKTASGDLLLPADKGETHALVVVSATDGKVLRQVPVFRDVQKGVLTGAIETSTGDVAVYGRTYESCLHVELLDAKFSEVKWQKNVCSKTTWRWTPATAVATAKGDFVIGGREERSIDDKDRENEWDTERHRATLVGFNAKGYMSFSYATAEAKHWGWTGYDALTYDAKKDEVVAVGNLPYTGIADVFAHDGHFLLHATSHERWNTAFTGVAPMPDGTGYLITGSSGENSAYGASYHSAFAVLKR